MFTCVLGRYVAYSLISTQTFRKALTASVDRCAEIKSAPSVAYPILAEFGGRCRKAMLGVCRHSAGMNPSVRLVKRLTRNSSGNFRPSDCCVVIGVKERNWSARPDLQYIYICEVLTNVICFSYVCH